MRSIASYIFSTAVWLVMPATVHRVYVVFGTTGIFDFGRLDFESFWSYAGSDLFFIFARVCVCEFGEWSCGFDRYVCITAVDRTWSREALCPVEEYFGSAFLIVGFWFFGSMGKYMTR